MIGLTPFALLLTAVHAFGPILGATGGVGAFMDETQSVVVALNFLTHRPSLFAFPKATRPEHVRENAGALDFTLTAQDLSAIDAEHRR
jgi:aryl-alcohol dehydrogenase-like predicted oxidoreductase